jgi:GT2 family glycosyltransferase
MEQPDPSPDPPPERPDPVEPAAPPVVVVLVTRDPGPWFEEALAGLADSDYPALAVLVVDAGSEDDPTPRVAGLLPGAFVRRLPGNVGFAAAANEAREAVSGATFLLLCHDDVVLDPPAIRLLVEEAYRSNAAIVGPKLVDYERPEVLLEVGLSIDRFAVPHAGVEPGELDQEQHDAVRDVFYVSDAVMLVRADLFAELDGFDPETFPGGEDLDLCWRARLAGARVLVAPDARARHRGADTQGERDGATSPEVLQRHRVRAMLKAYSGWSLAYIVPAAILLALVEAAAFLVTRRRDRARALIGGWTWNLRHLSDVRAARRRTQALRAVPDSELRGLQVRGSARVSGFLVGNLQAEDRIRSLSERGRTMADTASTGVRTPQVLAVLLFALVALVGVRGLWFGGIPTIGQLPEWPGVTGLLETFTSQWRESGLGSTAPAPPVLAGFSALGVGLLGQTGLARTVLVLAALPVGMAGTGRLARRMCGLRWPAVGAAVVYGVNPLVRNAIVEGRLGPIVAFALAPFVLAGILRAAGYLPDDPPRRRWRTLVGTGALVAIATAAWPPALLLPAVVAVGLLVAAPLAGDTFARVRAVLAWTIGCSAVAAVLLLPWPLAYLRAGNRASALGFAFAPRDALSPLLRFATGPNGDTVLGWGFVGAALLVLLLAAGPRLAWAIRMWAVALVSFALAWLPGRWFPDGSVPAVEGVLVPAALALALVVGLGIAAFSRDVRRQHFGWRQLVAGLGAVALVGCALAFTADAGGGRWHTPDRGWNDTLSWMHGEASTGRYRVLWIGRPRVLPVDPFRSGDLAYGVTDDGPGDERDALPPPDGGATARLAGAVGQLVEDRSDRVGRLLAPMAVRYVVVPERSSPGSGRRAPAPLTLRDSLADQIDFVRLESGPDLILYENRAWIPQQAVVTRGEVPVRAPSELDAPVDPGSVAVLPEGATAPAGTVLWSEAYSGAWEAQAAGGTLPHRRAFGWANAYRLDRRSEVSFSFADQWMRYPAVLLQVALIVGAFLLWRGSARFRIRRGRAGAPGESDGDTGGRADG